MIPLVKTCAIYRTPPGDEAADLTVTAVAQLIMVCEGSDRVMT